MVQQASHSPCVKHVTLLGTMSNRQDYTVLQIHMPVPNITGNLQCTHCWSLPNNR
uniref:Uncharacterized protein n=1 Tax=Rhizophora mucronata TaxID=61149 RepID=A0A2P2M5Z4_RHIMU